MRKQFKQPWIKERAGRGLETSASALSISRVVGGVAIAQHIMQTKDYQSWKLAFGFGVLAATDALDGRLARFGRRLLGKDESVRRPFNAYVDQLSDKAMITVIMGALSKREAANGHTKYARVLFGCTALDTVRNAAVTYDRVLADRQDIDTRAQSSGKLKALEQALVVGAALSPISRTSIGRAAIGLAASHATASSVKSGWELHESFTNARNERDISSDTIADVVALPLEPETPQIEEYRVLPQSVSPPMWN